MSVGGEEDLRVLLSQRLGRALLIKYFFHAFWVPYLLNINRNNRNPHVGSACQETRLHQRSREGNQKATDSENVCGSDTECSKKGLIGRMD